MPSVPGISIQLNGLFFAVLALAVILLGVAAFFVLKYWRRYVQAREMVYQPLILMAIANEQGGRLGPVFDERRPGDWGIVEKALFNWSKSLSGFSHKGFRRIFDLNGFGEYERERLQSLRASVRLEAAQRLGEMVYFKAIPDLLPMLQDRSPEVRRMASWALAKLGQSDATGLAVTSAIPEILREDAGKATGAVMGRLLWESGEPIVIGNTEETAYLVHRRGGMHADVRNLPILGPGGRQIEGGAWRTYTKEYRLPKVSPARPAIIKAVLKEAVGDYYAVLHRQRENILVRAGSVTKNIDFVFPRYEGPEDRVSIAGKLIYPGKIQPGYRAGFSGGRPKAVVSLRGIRSSFFSGYLSFWKLEEYRLHEVPPGRYKIKATIADYTFEGIVNIPQAQPVTLDLKLKVPGRP